MRDVAMKRLRFIDDYCRVKTQSVTVGNVPNDSVFRSGSGERNPKPFCPNESELKPTQDLTFTPSSFCSSTLTALFTSCSHSYRFLRFIPHSNPFLHRAPPSFLPWLKATPAEGRFSLCCLTQAAAFLACVRQPQHQLSNWDQTKLKEQFHTCAQLRPQPLHYPHHLKHSNADSLTLSQRWGASTRWLPVRGENLFSKVLLPAGEHRPDTPGSLHHMKET